MSDVQFVDFREGRAQGLFLLGARLRLQGDVGAPGPRVGKEVL